MIKNEDFMQTFETWTKSFADFLRNKGKVQPGNWRAYEFKIPTNLWQEAKTGIHSWMLCFGITPEYSSVEKQKEMQLNKDTTLRPAKSEGEKLRAQ